MITTSHGIVYLYIAFCYAMAALGLLPAVYAALVPAYLVLALEH